MATLILTIELKRVTACKRAFSLGGENQQNGDSLWPLSSAIANDCHHVLQKRFHILTTKMFATNADESIYDCNTKKMNGNIRKLLHQSVFVQYNTRDFVQKKANKKQRKYTRPNATTSYSCSAAFMPGQAHLLERIISVFNIRRRRRRRERPARGLGGMEKHNYRHNFRCTQFASCVSNARVVQVLLLPTTCHTHEHMIQLSRPPLSPPLPHPDE